VPEAHALFGFAALLLVAWCLSAKRWQVSVRIEAGRVFLQIALAILLIKLPPATAVFPFGDLEQRRHRRHAGLILI